MTGAIDERHIVLRGRVVTEAAALGDAVVEVRDGVITRVGTPAPGDPPPTDATVLPGLIDVHCHGGGGESFPDSDVSALPAAVRHHRRHGTTTLVASLVSAPPERLLERLDALSDSWQTGEIAGVHLEGPFLSAARCGAQNPAALIPGDPGLLRELIAAGNGSVVSMTVAPETARFDDLASVLRTHRVVPSLGHTNADAAVTTRAIEVLGDGPVTATHLFNGMPSWHHRAPGPVAACLAAAGRGQMVLELIGDGVHLAPETVRTVFDLVGPDRVTLVSDAMAAAGMEDGRYRLGSLDVTVRDRIARLSDSDGVIAGGTATALEVVRRSVVDAGLDVVDAVRAASLTPARLLGLGDSVGRIAVGLRADLVVTDTHLLPRTVIRRGVPVDEGADAWRS